MIDKGAQPRFGNWAWRFTAYTQFRLNWSIVCRRRWVGGSARRRVGGSAVMTQPVYKPSGPHFVPQAPGFCTPKCKYLAAPVSFFPHQLSCVTLLLSLFPFLWFLLQFILSQYRLLKALSHYPWLTILRVRVANVLFGLGLLPIKHNVTANNCFQSIVNRINYTTTHESNTAV